MINLEIEGVLRLTINQILDSKLEDNVVYYIQSNMSCYFYEQRKIFIL